MTPKKATEVPEGQEIRTIHDKRLDTRTMKFHLESSKLSAIIQSEVWQLHGPIEPLRECRPLPRSRTGQHNGFAPLVVNDNG